MKKLIFTALTLSLLGTGQAQADEVTDESAEAVVNEKLVAQKDTTKKSSGALVSDRKVMLNAESSTTPRTINIGIPLGADLVIEENDVPVIYGFYPQLPIMNWRKDASIGSIGLLTFGETAIKTGKVGLSVESQDRHASNKLRGFAEFFVDNYGSSRYNVSLTGPLSKNGWGFMLDFYQNNERANGIDWKFYPWKDRTTIAKVGIEKKYKNGNVRLIYKYGNFRYIMTNNGPMIYEGDGQPKEYPGYNTAKDSYILASGLLPTFDPYTGEAKVADIASDEYMEAESHNIYLTGEHRFRSGFLNKWRLNYTLSFLHDDSPNVVSFPVSLMAQQVDQQGNETYWYHGTDKQYNGDIAWVMGSLIPKSNNNYWVGRAELTRKTKKNNWNLGAQLQHYHSRYINSSTFFISSVEKNPVLLDWKTPYEVAPGYVMQVPVSDAETGGLPARIGGGYGSMNNTYVTKAALYAKDDIKITPKWDVTLGVRAELQNMREHKYANGYTADYSKYETLNDVTPINHDFGNNLNYSATVNTLYKIGRNWGVLADATVLSWKESYWDYENRDANNLPIPGADGIIRMNQPGTTRSTVSNMGAGLYFNWGTYVQLVSKVLLTQKNNIRFSDATITNPDNPQERRDCGPIYYDLRTLGWTTDVMINPFKNFNLHYLITVQSPKYKNFDYSAYGVEYSYSDNYITSLSRVLMEIDPSYTMWKGKARLWVSLRYFGKQYANMTNAFYYDGWWENFGGLDLNFSRNFSLKFQVTNFLDQKGIKGDVQGANQIVDAKPYIGRILMASGMRPRTFEVTADFKF